MLVNEKKSIIKQPRSEFAWRCLILSSIRWCMCKTMVFSCLLCAYMFFLKPQLVFLQIWRKRTLFLKYRSRVRHGKEGWTEFGWFDRILIVVFRLFVCFFGLLLTARCVTTLDENVSITALIVTVKDWQYDCFTAIMSRPQESYRLLKSIVFWTPDLSARRFLFNFRWQWPLEIKLGIITYIISLLSTKPFRNFNLFYMLATSVITRSVCLSYTNLFLLFLLVVFSAMVTRSMLFGRAWTLQTAC